MTCTRDRICFSQLPLVLILIISASAAQSESVSSPSQDATNRFLEIEQRYNSMITQSERLRDYSPAGLNAWIDQHRVVLAELDSIDGSALDHYSAVSYDVIRWDAQIAIDQASFRWLQFPYTPYEYTIRGPNAVFTSFMFRSPSDVSTYLGLLRQYKASVESIAAYVLAQKEHGIYLQRDAAAKVHTLIAETAKPPQLSFAWPSDARLDSLDAANIRKLRSKLDVLIRKQVNQAINRLADQFGKEYQTSAPATYGLAQYPEGKQYYRVLIRRWLTLDRSPELLLEASLASLDAIESELTALRAEMGYFGPRREFDEKLAFSKDFTARAPSEIEARYQEYMGRIDPLLPSVFCRAAPFGYGVARLPEELEPALNYGYADVVSKPVKRGMFFYNASELDKKSLLTAQGLIYHELAPGHYWHAAISSITGRGYQGDFGSSFRSNAGFAEAWGDYAQVLAYELGVFGSPAEKYGRLLFKSMFHARAVADIGVNYYGWDFERGLAVLNRFTSEPESVNRASLSRDTSDWQAQILPYSIGSSEIVRQREHVRFALGNAFDSARFHDAVLATGGVPFPILQDQLDWFIEQERAGGAVGVCE